MASQKPLEARLAKDFSSPDLCQLHGVAIDEVDGNIRLWTGNWDKIIGFSSRKPSIEIKVRKNWVLDAEVNRLLSSEDRCAVVERRNLRSKRRRSIRYGAHLLKDACYFNGKIYVLDTAATARDYGLYQYPGRQLVPIAGVTSRGDVKVVAANREALFIPEYRGADGFVFYKMSRSGQWEVLDGFRIGGSGGFGVVGDFAYSMGTNMSLLRVDINTRKVQKVELEGGKEAFEPLPRPSGFAVKLIRGRTYIGVVSEHHVRLYNLNFSVYK